MECPLRASRAIYNRTNRIYQIEHKKNSHFDFNKSCVFDLDLPRAIFDMRLSLSFRKDLFQIFFQFWSIRFRIWTKIQTRCLLTGSMIWSFEVFVVKTNFIQNIHFDSLRLAKRFRISKDSKRNVYIIHDNNIVNVMNIQTTEYCNVINIELMLVCSFGMMLRSQVIGLPYTNKQ